MAPRANTDDASLGNTPLELQDFLIVDDLLRARAADKIQTPLLCFPRTERGVIDYEGFTGSDIDRFVDHAAKYYLRHGLQPIKNSHQTPKVIALLAPTTLAYLITVFALARLGFTILCLSPRLAPNACAKLMEETRSFTVIPGRASQLSTLVVHTNDLHPVETILMVEREDFDLPPSLEPRFQRQSIDREVEKNWTFLISHSSGSTGLPKPVYMPHRRLMMKVPVPKSQVELSTFPFFHGYGSWIMINAIMARKTVYMNNSHLPLTADYVIQVMEHIRPDVLHAVPYTLELLALSEKGIDAMKDCQRVIFSGSGCPDELGDSLVAKGVNLVSVWGATEMGSLGASFNRPLGDNTWDYIRIPPPIAKYIKMKPLGDETYECVYLHGLPALVESNSDDPPKSFHSKDIFLKHPNMDAWKHIGRLNDRLTLTNGEKVLPVPMEGRIRQDRLIKECCVFGAGKSTPGILVFRNEESMTMPDEVFIEAIWPTIQQANACAESFAHISKEAIIPLSAEIDYPKTDKESIKRAQMYFVFAKEIEAMYEKLDNASTGTLRLEIPEVEKWIMNTFREALNVRLLSKDDDFFAAGVNSLQAIQMRGLILRDLNIGSNSRKLGQNVIFDTGSAARLAKHLYALRVDQTAQMDMVDGAKEMEALIAKYSHKRSHVVVLTGATGSLGAHILSKLLSRSDVSAVYCLVRGNNPSERVAQALQQQNLTFPKDGVMCALSCDLSRADLGLLPDKYEKLQKDTTCIIHTAWAVNFNLSTSSFEDQHIKGVDNLVRLSLSVSSSLPAHLFFCSSVAVALATPGPAKIPEAPIHDLTAALPQGYARSKLISEHILRNAASDAGARTRSLRIGQIVGDGRRGLWNDIEAIPLILRSALTLGVLPALHETQSWLPVDIVASTILDLAGITTPRPPASDFDTNLVYNLVNSNTFSWTDDLLPELQRSGLSFAIVPVDKWLQKLRDYQRTGGDPERNPAVKLLDHFERTYFGTENKASGITFETKTALNHSKALREAPRIIEDGYVKKFVNVWLETWKDEGNGLNINTSG